MAIPLRVLIIEDSDSNAGQNVRELKKAGYKITYEMVSTGKNMKAILHTQTFDLIIANHNLPQFDSFKAMAVLKGSALDIPFLVVSGPIGEETAAQVMKAGAQDYFLKGNLSRLGSAVERELREKEVRSVSRQAEEELRQSEKRYSTIVEKGSDGVIVLQDGLLKFANDKAVKITGLSLKEVTGKPFTDFVAPQYRELVTERYKGRITGQDIQSKYEIEIINKDGPGIFVEVNASLVDYDGKPAVLSMIRDITERKQAEEKINQAAEEWRTTFDSISDMVCLLDKEQKIIRVNKRFAEVLKTQPGELAGKQCYREIHGSVACLPSCPQIKMKKTLKPESFEYYEPKLGIYIEETVSPIFSATHEITGSVHIMKNITERKRAIEKLTLSEYNYRTILATAIDGFWLVGGRGKLVEVNDSYSRMSGYSTQELLSMHISDIEAAEISVETAAHMQKIMEQGSHTFESRHRRKDGSVFGVEISAQYRETDGGQFVVFLRDITERKKMQEQLIAQDRLVSIGQLVAGIAHEINNPLTSVIGFSELLARRDLPDDIKGDLAIVNAEAQRAATIVKGLLTFARKQPEGKDPININTPVQIVMKLNAHRFALNNIQVNTHLAEGLPQIIGNDSQLQQVFFNISMNAEQIMLEAHGKGVITITTEQVGNIVRVSFADDGPGISPENMKKLFTPFFTTKEMGKGTGLGLSICHGIVTEHGGKIYAESELGKGATFIVELPISQVAVNKDKANG